MRARAAVLLVLAVLAAALPAAALHEPRPVEVRPGERINGDCTVAFVLDGADGHVYLATAAHCFSSNGADVRDRSGTSIGTVVLRVTGALDYALVRLHAGAAAVAEAEVVGHPGMPSGVAGAADAALGDELAFSGWGLGLHLAHETREGRTGVLHRVQGAHWYGAAPLARGDSGGPVLHRATGKALGLVNSIQSDALGNDFGWRGTTLEALLADAGLRGMSLSLRIA